MGKPFPSALAIGHDIGCDARPFMGEEPPGAPHAALHLVEDEHEAGLVTDRA